jgi:HSP20 family protein
VNPEDLDITIKDQHLVLRGERKISTEEKNVNYHRRERESGFFRRVLRLPAEVDPNKVEAACKDGVLTISLAKPEEVKPRQISVKSA